MMCLISSRRSSIARLLCILCLTAASYAQASTQVYVTRDAAGNLTFSDRASADSEAHDVNELPTVPAFVPPSADRAPPTAAPVQPERYYTSLQILSPSNQENIPTGLAASLNILIDVIPALRAEDTFVVLVDGSPIASGHDNSIPINQLIRGQHLLEAVIKDANNKEILRSPAVTVYIQRHSIQNQQLQR